MGQAGIFKESLVVCVSVVVLGCFLFVADAQGSVSSAPDTESQVLVVEREPSFWSRLLRNVGKMLPGIFVDQAEVGEVEQERAVVNAPVAVVWEQERVETDSGQEVREHKPSVPVIFRKPAPTASTPDLLIKQGGVLVRRKVVPMREGVQVVASSRSRGGSGGGFRRALETVREVLEKPVALPGLPGPAEVVEPVEVAEVAEAVEPAEVVHSHTHNYDEFLEELFDVPVVPRSEPVESHKVQLIGNGEQKTVVTIKDSNGGIVDVREGSEVVRFEDLYSQEEYTISAQAEGRCGRLQQVEDAGENRETTISFEGFEENVYTYRWESDLQGRVYECSSHIPRVREVVYLNERITIPNNSAADVLRNQHNILLSDEGLPWTTDFAQSLLTIVDSIPHRVGSEIKFVLSDEEIHNDIRVESGAVYLSRHAFINATPRMVTLNGRRGKFFSHRLFHALTRFYTDGGSDRRAVEKILNDKFGVTLEVRNIKKLTGEHRDNFQEFHNEEVLDLITAFAEMPAGQYEIPGLRYILRRKDGHPHPRYPGAPAVAWPRGAATDSYIEFMESAFYSASRKKKVSQIAIHRLILHEKTHFLWTNVVPEALQNEWIELAGWYENEDDKHGWSTRYTTNFVSPYAHHINPGEDFAETVAYYITTPNKLLNVAPEKYDFIEKYIMHGNQYISEIRSDLQFEVLNLFPDYDYPGKIKRVEVTATGAPEDAKRVVVEIELSDKEGYNDGATWARTRISSEAGTFKDLYLYPVDGDEHTLRGVLTIPKSAKGGYWSVDAITVRDTSKNTRMEGIVDFGFMLYINNIDEDTTPPEYVPDSLNVEVVPGTREGRPVHKVIVTWDILEERGMKERNGVYVNFVPLSNPEAYSIGTYGTVNEENQARTVIDISEHYPAGDYAITYLRMVDKALNTGTQYFSDDPEHEPVTLVNIQTADPDTEKAVIDVNRISVNAVPINPESPDGQTKVSIIYYAKDDKSGVGKVYFKLQDPVGNFVSRPHYHSNFYKLYFTGGDPTVYKRYEITHILPIGSAPGIWGLREFIIEDKGGNINTYDFEELLQFELVDEPEGEPVQEEVVEESQPEVVVPEEDEAVEAEPAEDAVAEPAEDEAVEAVETPAEEEAVEIPEENVAAETQESPAEEIAPPAETAEEETAEVQEGSEQG